VIVDEREDLLLGRRVGELGCLDPLDEARGAVVRFVPRIHRFEHFIRLLDHEIGTDRDLGEVAVGDDRRDLDDAFLHGIEPGHLHVHPDEEVAVAGHAANLSQIAAKPHAR
jgi:hypothetical protein